MITLQKHEICATVKDRYANIVYCFHFENMNNNNNNNNNNGSDELQFEMTVHPNAFISKFTADIDGELFVGQTKEKETASKEYNVAKKKNENAILIDQPNKDIPNLFRIKSNIDAKSKVILNIAIQQYLQKKFNFNELNIQILRSFCKYNIKDNFEHIPFKLNIADMSGIYDVNIPMMHNSDIVIDQQIMDKLKQNYQIKGKITRKSPESTEGTADEWRKTLKITDQIDVKDRGSWYLSEVVDIDAFAGKIKIHFYGYDVKYDVYINVNSDGLAMANTKTANGKSNELTLKYKVKGETADSHILFDHKSGTFCHIISDVITDSMLMDKGPGQQILIPRRVLFVIDKSGSMGGSKWIKTTGATIMAVKQLRTGHDRFGIILFNDTLQHLRDCILANNVNINESVNALQNANAGGGTNINDALLKAIELIKNDILLLNNDHKVKHNFFINQILFITDGEARNGETDTNKILTNVKNANDLRKIDKYNNKICVFSFGVGKDTNDSEWTQGLNHSFLKLLSVNNSGFYSRIKTRSADTELSQYFNILSSPILSNINVEYKDRNVCQLTNTHFNALYSGNDLIICGKIKSKQDLTSGDYKLSLVISAVSGKQVKGNKELMMDIDPIHICKQLTININSETVESTQRIWAYLKLKQFATQKLIHNDMIEIDDDEKKEEQSLPLSLALKYKFVTPWTSMIVVKQKETKQNVEYDHGMKQKRLTPHATASYAAFYNVYKSKGQLPPNNLRSDDNEDLSHTNYSNINRNKASILKDKVVAVNKLMRMYRVLKENQDNIIKLKQLSPNGPELPPSKSMLLTAAENIDSDSIEDMYIEPLDIKTPVLTPTGHSNLIPDSDDDSSQLTDMQRNSLVEVHQNSGGIAQLLICDDNDFKQFDIQINKCQKIWNKQRALDANIQCLDQYENTRSVTLQCLKKLERLLSVIGGPAAVTAFFNINTEISQTVLQTLLISVHTNKNEYDYEIVDKLKDSPHVTQQQIDYKMMVSINFDIEYLAIKQNENQYKQLLINELAVVLGIHGSFIEIMSSVIGIGGCWHLDIEVVMWSYLYSLKAINNKSNCRMRNILQNKFKIGDHIDVSRKNKWYICKINAVTIDDKLQQEKGKNIRIAYIGKYIERNGQRMKEMGKPFKLKNNEWIWTIADKKRIRVKQMNVAESMMDNFFKIAFKART